MGKQVNLRLIIVFVLLFASIRLLLLLRSLFLYFLGPVCNRLFVIGDWLLQAVQLTSDLPFLEDLEAFLNSFDVGAGSKLLKLLVVRLFILI